MWRTILPYLQHVQGTGLCWLCDLPAALTSGLCATCYEDLPRLPPVPLGQVAAPGVNRLHLAALAYQQPVRRWLTQLKFHQQAGLARYLAPLLAAQAIATYGRQRLYLPDALVPVPLSRRRWLQRGFNQADVLARELGHYLGLPVIYPLIRHRHTRASHRLNARERTANLQAAFRDLGGATSYRRLAIVDDILTSGATTAAVSHVLTRERRCVVDCWAVAYTPPKTSTARK